MYASVRRYQTNEADELMRLVQEEFVPIISQAPGFIAYYGIDQGDGVVASINIFENQAGVETSNRMAAEWVKANLAALLGRGRLDHRSGDLRRWRGVVDEPGSFARNSVTLVRIRAVQDK